MTEIVALWAPDIEPPEHWLVPAILYQDKVATFSPEPYLDERDGQASRRIQRLLGDLYEPVSLPSGFSRSDLIEADLRSRLPTWIETARRLDPGRTSYIGRWAERASSFARRELAVTQQLRESTRGLEGRTLQLDRLGQRVNELTGQLRHAEEKLATLKAAARPKIEAANVARREALAPLIQQSRTLSRRRQGLDRETDEYREVCRDLDELHVQMKTVRRANSTPRDPELEATGEVVGALRAKLRDPQAKLASQRHEMSRLRRQREAQQQWIDSPWGEAVRSPTDPGFRVDDLWGLPRELDTIAVGKIYGGVFRFLASYGGLWVATRRDRPWVGTLVGPSFVIDEIMMIVAHQAVEDRPDCVLMVSEERRKAISTPTDVAASSAAVSWLLPVPLTSDLEAVRAFRERHANELEVLRAHLRAPLSAADSVEALQEAIRDIDVSCQAAARDIRRALELDRKVGLDYVRGSVISEISATLGNAAVAAGLGVIPVVKASVIAGALAGVPAGLLVAGVTLTAATATNSLRARAARRRVPSPFLYSYEAVRRIDPNHLV